MAEEAQVAPVSNDRAETAETLLNTISQSSAFTPKEIKALKRYVMQCRAESTRKAQAQAYKKDILCPDLERVETQLAEREHILNSYPADEVLFEIFATEHQKLMQDHRSLCHALQESK